MKKLLSLFCLMICTISFIPVYAVDFEVEVNPATAFTHPADWNTYYMGNTQTYMDIKMGNNSGTDIVGLSMTLKFFSTNGDGTPIVWIDEGGTPVGSIVSMNGWEYYGYWDFQNQINIFNWDGILPDTVNHTAIGHWQDGDPTQTRLRFHFMVPTAGVDPFYDIVEICVDQSNAPDPTYDWLFPDGAQFGGPYCFEFLSAVIIPPYIENLPLSLTTAHDVPYHYIGQLECPIGDPLTDVTASIGTIDFTPGSWSFEWTFDPPCEWINDGLSHLVTFELWDAVNGHMPWGLVYSMNLYVTEGGAPEISENFQSDILVRIGETGDVTVELEDPCDDDIWSYESTYTPYGAVGFDNATLTFTPEEGDDWKNYPFIIRATDCLDNFDEVEILFWARSEIFCGDIVSYMSVDILDVVYIINALYKNGPGPGPLEIADVNSDGGINILDVVAILNFKYKDGPALNCPEWE